MGSSCSAPETTAGNAFYADGDQATPKAEEEKPPSPKPMRSVSKASLFYNDGDVVMEEKESTSCWGKSSKPKSPLKRPTRPASRAETEKERKGKKKKTKNRRKTSAARGNNGKDRHNHSLDDGNERSNQRMNQVAPEAARFYQDPKRIEDALGRRKTMQRAMNQAYDDNKSVSSAESDDERKPRRKKSTSCFAGLCQSKEKTVASNFHNQ